MNKHENILVVPRCELAIRGLLADRPGILPADALMGEMVELVVREAGEFLPRPLMEISEAYKQIIPYMVFVHDRRVFVMQRSGVAGEQRLAHKYTIGIGGHVQAGDVSDLCGEVHGHNAIPSWPMGLAEWGKREFAEEVAYDGDFSSITLCGLVNDDRDAVGRVHLGVVFVLHATSNVIAVRSELKSGVLMDKQQFLAVYDRMETWSQFVLSALIEASVV